MGQVIKDPLPKQMISLSMGCYLLETTSNEVGYSSESKREYIDFSGGNSGGSSRSFYIEVSEGYLVLNDGSSYSLIQLPQDFSRFDFNKIA